MMSPLAFFCVVASSRHANGAGLKSSTYRFNRQAVAGTGDHRKKISHQEVLPLRMLPIEH